MKIAREGYALIVVALGLALGSALLGWYPLSGLLFALALAVTGFFRDPERQIPVADSLVVAPADGRVVTIDQVPSGRLLGKAGQRLSIFLSPLDVHINRSPIPGIVEEVEYHAGHFFAAYRGKASDENEQNAVRIVHPAGGVVSVVQIAGFLARRIVCRVGKGDSLERGQRFGMIMFGSRVDLFLPSDAHIEVRQGEHVRGGETVVARMRGV